MKRIVILSFVLVSLLTSIWMVYTIINRNSTDNTIRLNMEALASSEGYQLGDCIYKSSVGYENEFDIYCLDDESGYYSGNSGSDYCNIPGRRTLFL